MTRIYAIGDIHGQLEALLAAHSRIAADRARTGDMEAPVVHLGDLVDRGPDSCGVIQYLIEGLERGEPWIVLKGNHDQIFAGQLGLEAGDPVDVRAWTSDSMGGRQTAASYGVEFGMMMRSRVFRQRLTEAVPDSHKSFLKALKSSHVTEDLLFVHAGIRPGLELSEQIEDDLLWIRGDFLNDPRDHGRLIVHGHTPAKVPEHRGNRVNLDTGAGYGRPLSVAVFEGRDVWVLDCEDGRVPLEPTAAEV